LDGGSFVAPNIAVIEKLFGFHVSPMKKRETTTSVSRLLQLQGDPGRPFNRALYPTSGALKLALIGAEIVSKWTV